jgi:Flp pilus assembly protein TadD
MDGMKQAPDAVEHAMKAVRAGTENPDLHAGPGDVLMEFGQLDEAASQYRAATDRNPRHAYSFIGLGTLARRLGQSEQAIGHYRKALMINPVEPYAHGALASSWLRLVDSKRRFHISRDR